MSRTFNGSTDFLEASSAAVTAAPLTMVCWFRANNITARGTLLSIGRADHDQHYFDLTADGQTSGDPIRATSRDSGGIATAYSTSGYASGVWSHAAAVFTSSSARAAFLNGANKGVETTPTTPSGLDITGVGRLTRLSPVLYFDGAIAEAAIWNVALSDAEVAVLARGVSPLALTHRLGALVLHQDLIRSLNRPGVGPMLSASGTSVATHPRIFVPPTRHVFSPYRIAGPYSTSAGAAFLSGAVAGEAFFTGAAIGDAA